MEHTQVAATPRERFMRAAETEMAKFERREIEFQGKERQERAAELDILALSSNLGTPDAYEMPPGDLRARQINQRRQASYSLGGVCAFGPPQLAASSFQPDVARWQLADMGNLPDVRLALTVVILTIIMRTRRRQDRLDPAYLGDFRVIAAIRINSAA
jgi:hypothetical protein